MAKTERKVQVLVSVDDQHLPKMGELVERCKAAGLDVEYALDAAGTITGSIDPKKIAKLSKLAGISNVEQSQEYGIAPPESDIQ